MVLRPGCLGAWVTVQGEKGTQLPLCPGELGPRPEAAAFLPFRPQHLHNPDKAPGSCTSFSRMKLSVRKAQ